jgi:integrase
MATIRKRAWRSPSGEAREAWTVDFRDQAGTRRHKQFATRKAADAFLVKARADVAAGMFTPDSTSITLAKALALWLDRAAAEGLEHGTQVQYRQHKAHILALIDGATKLARISHAQCEQLRDDLLKRHSRELARKVLVSFKAVLRDMRRRRLMAANPAAETTIKPNRRHKAKLKVGVDVPTPAEVRAMLDAAGPQTKAMVALAALSGLRASELRALSWASVDLGREPTVTVEVRADRWSKVGSPKSAAGRRTVPLGQTAVQALREWRLAQPPGRKLVFGTASDRPDMLTNLRRRLLVPLWAAAGVPRYGWHSLRHYAISSWLAAHVDPKTAQHWAGHSNLTETLNTYGHMIPRADDHQRIAAAERALLG